MRLLLFAFAALILIPPPVVDAGSGTMSGASNSMNPALSVNVLCRAIYFQNDENAVDGFKLEEAEMHFTSIVDPFWKANVIIAVFPIDNGSAFDLGIEEANIDGTALPGGLALKLGKFFVPFGKHAPLHTHQFPFANAPLCVSTFLGEGLTDMGASLTCALPTVWFSDLIAYSLSGTTEIFDNENHDPAIGGRWLNLLDASDNATLELGTSFLHGAASNDYFGEPDYFSVYGFDLTYKWISSTSSHGPAFTIMSELLLPDFSENTGSPFGWYTLAQYRCHHNWWLGCEIGQIDCGDGSGTESPFNGERMEYQMNATFAPSAFSSLRAGAALYTDPNGVEDDDLQLVFQWNFTIGSHPAHHY